MTDAPSPPTGDRNPALTIVGLRGILDEATRNELRFVVDQWMAKMSREAGLDALALTFTQTQHSRSPAGLHRVRGRVHAHDKDLQAEAEDWDLLQCVRNTLHELQGRLASEKVRGMEHRRAHNKAFDRHPE